jgi:hypothetical protein
MNCGSVLKKLREANFTHAHLVNATIIVPDCNIDQTTTFENANRNDATVSSNIEELCRRKGWCRKFKKVVENQASKA